MSKKQNLKQRSSKPVQPKENLSVQGSPSELQRCQEKLESARQEIKNFQNQAEDISRREAAVSDGERRLADLKKREAEISEKQSALEKQEAEVAAVQSATTAREGKVAERERVVREQEIAAEAGFERRNRESLKKLEDEYAVLREQLDEMRTNALKKLDAELAQIREQAQARLDVELDGRREHFDAEIAQQRADIKGRNDSLTEAQRKLDERETQVTLRERKVASDELILTEERGNLQETIDQSIRDDKTEFEYKLKEKDERIDRLMKERDRFEKKVNEAEDWRRRFGHKEPEEWIEDFHKLEEYRDRLREELLKCPSLDDGDRLANLEEERRQWEQKRTEMNRELGELRARESDWLIPVAELEQLKNLKAVAERRVETLQAEQEKLRKDVGDLRSLYEQPKEREARVGVIEQPRFEKLPSLAPEVPEKDWLDKIHQLCKESGLIFPHRLLYAFHTSLKTADWTPLTVLGGVSGTGKSELPRLYARFGGLAFEPLSVQPNWDSPQSLFGFFNSVDNRFNATPLLRSLVQSQQKPDSETYSDGMNDRLLLVLLDEMNLSHVELYFSDLLSKLELRRGEKNGVKIEVDLGAGLEQYEVPLGGNVLWVGTMNEDETTKTLSDKVLDRANLIGFPRPQELRRRKKATLAKPQPMLSWNTWHQWLCHESALKEEEIGKYKQTVEHISQCLEEAGRALGHRVWQAIESYMANYPGVRDSADEEAKDKALRLAFEDALVHKVMPKLRGIETSGESKRKCLDPINEELLSDSDLGLNLAADFELACSVGYAFAWRSAKYLEDDQ